VGNSEWETYFLSHFLRRSKEWKMSLTPFLSSMYTNNSILKLIPYTKAVYSWKLGVVLESKDGLI
jgi:hypothetical protein